MYFVHSYHLRARDPRHVLASTDYGGPVAAVVGRDNIVGTQFHPEKSQTAGLRMLGDFLRWRP
jgi:glutamine amidotransferase